MIDRDTTAAWAYHDGTKHSVASLEFNRHFLDWEIKPLPFKVYPGLEPIALPRELQPSTVPALDALTRAPAVDPDRRVVPTLHQLARLLHFSAGITRKRVFGDDTHYFRAAPCTGALYHVDLYVICGDLPGLAAGVYQFGPHNFALHRLRDGDWRGALVEATGDEPSARHAPVIVVCASTYWRNAWKYQARAYRHCFWDSGTLLANLLAVAAADDLPARVIGGFVDATVGVLLGLDERREAPLALVALGHDPGARIAPPAPLAPVQLDTMPLSTRQVDYPAIREIQAASSLETPAAVAEWRSRLAVPGGAGAPGGREVALRPLDEQARPRDPIDSVITRRGSTREFTPASISYGELSTLLQAGTRAVPSDHGASPSDVYVIAHAVEGLSPGAYVYQRQAQSLALLRDGEFRRQAGHLGLAQDLPAAASVNLYMLCDLKPVLRRFGNRGYRVAQLDGAIIGGKLYLAAYAQRLGATGLTFFDDEVTEFFSPHAAGKSVMFLVAVGRGRRPGLRPA
jgi:SagB-type dehydrogenase family enzyme